MSFELPRYLDHARRDGMIGGTEAEMRAQLAMYSRRYSMRNFMVPMTIRIELGADAYRYGHHQVPIVVVIKATVPDRQTGRPIPLFMSRGLYLTAPRFSLAWLDDMIHRCVVDFAQHEAEEALHIDGRREFDPHRNEPEYKPEHAQPEPPKGFNGAPGSYREPVRRPLRFLDAKAWSNGGQQHSRPAGDASK